MSKTVDEEMQKLWEQATPEQKYIIVRFMRNIVKSKKRPERDSRFGRFHQNRSLCVPVLVRYKIRSPSESS